MTFVMPLRSLLVLSLQAVVVGGGDHACFVARGLDALGAGVTLVTTRPGILLQGSKGMLDGSMFLLLTETKLTRTCTRYTFILILVFVLFAGWIIFGPTPQSP